MGEVYRARDPALKREVAIKVLPSFVSRDPDRLRRFEQEAQAAAALDHPNILAVHQFGVFDGSPYLVSELLVGESLRQRAAARPVAGSQSHRLRHPDRAWIGRGARQRHRSSRPQAGEPLRHQRRPHQDSRLRTGEADASPTRSGRQRADGDPRHRSRHGDGHRRLHVSGAGARPDRRSSDRHLRLRSHPLRDADGQARLPAVDIGRDDDRHPQRRPARDFANRGEHPAGPAASRASLPGEESRAALSLGVGSGLCSGCAVGFGRSPAVAAQHRLAARRAERSCGPSP